MDETRSAVVSVGERLPAVALETVDGQLVDLHRTRHETSVLVFPHPRCDGCRAYVARLAALADRLDAWGGRVLPVVPAAAQAHDLHQQAGSLVLVDADGRCRAGAGLAPDTAAVVVADRFGTVYRSVSGGDGHELIEPDELFEEVRYMGSQCPECGVPDEPLRGEEAWTR